MNQQPAGALPDASIADALRGVTVEVGAAVQARCDAAMFRQGVVNLLDNAIKHTPPCGAVRLVVRVLSSDEPALEVHDTGPGIAAVHLERIFERFYRVDADRARHTGVMGLGLAIARSAKYRKSEPTTPSDTAPPRPAGSHAGTTAATALERAEARHVLDVARQGEVLGEVDGDALSVRDPMYGHLRSGLRSRGSYTMAP